MKTMEDFNRFAGAELYPSLQGLENERQVLASRYLWPEIFIWIGFVCIVIAGFFMPTTPTKIIVFACALACLVYAIIHSVKAGKEKKLFREHYKQKIVGPMISFIDPSLKYMPESYIPENFFIESSLFMRTPDRYRGEDMVAGVMDKTALSFSEIHAEYKTESYDSKGRRRTQWHTLFKGIFFIADFNKSFKGRTIVLPDVAEKSFGSLVGNFFQKMNFTRGQLIKLENVEFEKEFAVYGDDQIESRYILTPDLMERLLNFKRNNKMQISISFITNRMFVALTCLQDLFEPTYFKTVIDRNMIDRYFSMLALVTGMVDEFNLNTRIWGKD